MDRERKGCAYPYEDNAARWCLCHERMGNDFWFLPSGECLFREEKPVGGEEQ